MRSLALALLMALTAAPLAALAAQSGGQSSASSSSSGGDVSPQNQEVNNRPAQETMQTVGEHNTDPGVNVQNRASRSSSQADQVNEKPADTSAPGDPHSPLSAQSNQPPR